jgi:hypothetical protein
MTCKNQSPLGDCILFGSEGCLAEKLGGDQEGCDGYEPDIEEQHS